MKRYFRPKAIIAILAVLLVLLGLFSGAQSSKVSALENQVSSVYQKSFYETVELMNAIEINLEKLMVTADDSQRQTLLSTVARQADAAQDNLAMLPESVETIASSIKFVNQTGDFCRTLAERLALGSKMADGDLITVETLFATCAALNARLNQMVVDLERGVTTLEAAYTLPPVKAESDGKDTEVSVDYPVLLYDGPFSDGRMNATMENLTGDKLDVDAAQALAQDFIGSDRVKTIRFTGESNIPAACFEFDAETDDGTLSIAVTQTGGHVLYMLTSRSPYTINYTQASCIDAAAQFLKSRGYPDMAVSYWQQADGILTVNYAAMQNGVILYSDLVKVEVSMETGLVVGIEAINYLSNHKTRSLPVPAFSEEEALSKLNGLLTANRARLCVIPLDTGETLCYELSASLNGSTYLIYVDAVSGRERTILKIYEDDNGQLAI